MSETDTKSGGKQNTGQNNGVVRTIDGLDLFWQSWLSDRPSGVIVLIHGLAEHSSRYSETAAYFASHGWSVYACDLRGHGQSPDGVRPGRVHVDNFSDYLMDVSAILALSKERHPGLPQVILGHSMGGHIALSYAIDHPAELSGAVISSPLLATHPASRPHPLLDSLVRILARLFPRVLFSSDLDTDAVCRDGDVVKAYIDDPLVSSKISARWYVTTTKAIEDIQGRADVLKVPTLLMQSGADRLVDPEATKDWAALASPEMLELVIWEGLYHEMFNEPEKDLVRTCVLEWLQNSISKARA